ncbi:ABC transporter permease [Actinocatenispora thailandica]|uniref:ABC transporter permease n=1 Tax=Actinocatenispora thailandica TaxID=227318 RepID=UPI00194EBC82|nr:ABC transporter permease [Actinocatenispora thailandica]
MAGHADPASAAPPPSRQRPARHDPVPVSPAPRGAAQREPATRGGGAVRTAARTVAEPELDDGPVGDFEPGAHRREPRLVAELRVIGMVVRRELKKYLRSKAKILSSFVQPFFFLLIFGYGMRTLVRTTGGVSFEAFVFPGVIAMTVLGRSLLSAVTIVQDREFGFLREMLVSPASRISIVLGAILGGALISTVQAVLLFLGAPIMGLFPGPGTILAVLAGTGLMAVEVTALGVALATFIAKPQSFTAVTQALTYPMLVLSGALVPLAGLPSWVGTIATFNLFSYPVDAIRRLLIGSNVRADQGALTGLVLLGHRMSVTDELALTGVCTLLFVVLAAWRFARVS